MAERLLPDRIGRVGFLVRAAAAASLFGLLFFGCAAALTAERVDRAGGLLAEAGWGILMLLLQGLGTLSLAGLFLVLSAVGVADASARDVPPGMLAFGVAGLMLGGMAAVLWFGVAVLVRRVRDLRGPASGASWMWSTLLAIATLTPLLNAWTFWLLALAPRDALSGGAKRLAGPAAVAAAITAAVFATLNGFGVD